MAGYGIAYETLMYVDLDGRAIITHDEYGRKQEYKLPEDLELSEEWIIEHLGKGIKIIYKEEKGARTALRIEEL